MKKGKIKFIITGSQRSGTTLLNLLLNAHSKIEVIDEDKAGFHGEFVEQFFTTSKTQATGFKLPMVSNELGVLQKIKPDLILFIVRHPYDVIYSMINLQVGFNHTHPSMDWGELWRGVKDFIFTPKTLFVFLSVKLRLKKNFGLPWYFHPDCIDPEIRNSILPLANDYSSQNALGVHPLSRNRATYLKLAAKVWNYKNKILSQYEYHSLPYVILKYEDLLDDPKCFLTRVCDHLNFDYEEEMFFFYKRGKGKSIGDTSNTEEIKSDNYNKWRGSFTDAELRMIKNELEETANFFGYDCP